MIISQFIPKMPSPSPRNMTHSSKGSMQGGNHSHRIFGAGQSHQNKMLSINQRAGSKVS